MPKTYKMKRVAYAIRMGLCVAYNGKLRESKREVLYELLDDLAVALTTEAVEENNKRFQQYSYLVGELCDVLDVPLPNTKRQGKRR